ncbi:MAG TPA: glycosyltransferase, partial [Chondromyces sp.]|nr:glycosyltransferase [Chondromyces sp.]
IIILNKDSMSMDKWQEKAKDYENVRVYQLHEKATLGDCLNFGIELANHEYIAKFDDDDYYGPAYLSSAMEECKKHQLDILGKSSYYIYFHNEKALIFVSNEEESYVDSIAGATLVFRKEVWEQVPFEKMNRAEDYFFIKQSKEKGYKIYSANRYHFATIRYNTDKHTWKISNDELMEWGTIVAYTEDFQSIVDNKDKNEVEKR